MKCSLVLLPLPQFFTFYTPHICLPGVLLCLQSLFFVSGSCPEEVPGMLPRVRLPRFVAILFTFYKPELTRWSAAFQNNFTFSMPCFMSIHSNKDLRWQTRDDMPAPDNALQALVESYSRSAKDMGAKKFDAWVYGIICGWDDASYAELSVKHDWTPDVVAYNKLLHENYKRAWSAYMGHFHP